jgi:hypothetical protein
MTTIMDVANCLSLEMDQFIVFLVDMRSSTHLVENQKLILYHGRHFQAASKSSKTPLKVKASNTNRNGGFPSAYVL